MKLFDFLHVGIRKFLFGNPPRECVTKRKPASITVDIYRPDGTRETMRHPGLLDFNIDIDAPPLKMDLDISEPIEVDQHVTITIDMRPAAASKPDESRESKQEK